MCVYSRHFPLFPLLKLTWQNKDTLPNFQSYLEIYDASYMEHTKGTLIFFCESAKMNKCHMNLTMNKFGFPESLKCHLFGINKFYRASCVWNSCFVWSLFFLERQLRVMKLCLFHIAAWAPFHLSGGCHHYRWQCCKFKPMLSIYSF
jgi:hypothetical protein